MTDIDTELDELFKAARAAQKAERAKAHELAAKRKANKAPIEPPIEPLGIFVNPDNWREGRLLGLVHRDTKLFLGKFREMLHKSVGDARRLVRTDSPGSVEGVEEVDFGLPPNQQPLPASNRAVTQRIIEGPVHLANPPVSVLRAMLCVHYYDGATAKAVLVEPATFASGDEICQLPAGVDLLSALSRETKQAIRSY